MKNMSIHLAFIFPSVVTAVVDRSERVLVHVCSQHRRDTIWLVPHASATPVPGSREDTGKHKFTSISQAVITPSVLCCLLHLVFHLPQSCQCHRQTENSEENLEMRSSGESWREDEEDKESEMVWMHKCCLSWKLEKGTGGAANSQVSHLGAFCVWCFIACLTQGCCGKWPLY